MNSHSVLRFLWKSSAVFAALAVISSVSLCVTAAAEPLDVAEKSDNSFTLANDAVKLALSVHDDKQFITQFGTNSYTGTQYITSENEIALPDNISGEKNEWKFAGAEVDETDGKTVTLSFNSDCGKYVTHCAWEIKPGKGPVQYNCTVDIISGGRASFDGSVAELDDMTFNLDGDTTIWAFDRMKIAAEKDEPIHKIPVTAGYNNTFYVEDSFNNNEGDLPYLMFDVDGSHGFYYGFMWSYGNMVVSSQTGSDVRIDSGITFTRSTATAEQGETFEFPGMFIGAYDGNVDHGANNMKNWFWKYKITRSLYENKNEPDIELDWGTFVKNGLNQWGNSFYNEKSWKPYIDQYGLDGIGFEALKQDYDWTLGFEKDGSNPNPQVQLDAEESWSANPVRFPDGMNLYSVIHSFTDKVHFSIYMCNTYKGANLGEKSGQEAQINALKERFNKNTQTGEWGYDYWRSDFSVEYPYTYGWHQGLLNVLDEMIEWSKTQNHTFRYEHCATGGCLKDFTTLERATFMTTEDTAVEINYRRALYSCSYMINPVQLKSDINFENSLGMINSTGVDKDKYYNYVARSSLLGASMLAAPTSTWEQDGLIDDCRDAWALYKEKQRPILRGANVYHILDVPGTSRNSVYSGVNSYADWDGIEYYNDEIDKGSIFLFSENPDAPDEKTIVLDGLDENKIYNLTFEERTAQNCQMTGKQLMTDGITVTGMDGYYCSEIIWLEPDKTLKSTKAELDAAIKAAEKTDLSVLSDDNAWNFVQILNNAKETSLNNSATLYSVWYAKTCLDNAVKNQVTASPYTAIQCENAADADGLTVRESPSAGDGKCLAGAKIGTQVNLGEFDFGYGCGIKEVSLNYNSLRDTIADNAAVSVRLDSPDGTVIAKYDIIYTSAKNDDFYSKLFTTALRTKIDGIHEIWLTFDGTPANGQVNVADVDWIQFSSQSIAASGEFQAQRLSERIASIGEITAENSAYKETLVSMAEKSLDLITKKYKNITVAESDTLTAARAKLDELNPIAAGDVNSDKAIDSKDALCVLQFAVGKITLDANQQKAADVNGDGNADSSDALAILQKSVGKITEFEVEKKA